MKPTLNFAKDLVNAALRYPQSVGLVHGDDRWTWAELNADVDALAAGLRSLGVGRGDMIFVLTPNNRCAFETVYAAAKLAAIDVPLNFRDTASELSGFLKLCEPRYLIVDTGNCQKVQQVQADYPGLEQIIVFGELSEKQRVDGWLSYDELIAENRGTVIATENVQDEEICRLSFGSGTTGEPKALLHSFEQYAYTIVNRLADVLVGVGPTDAFLAIGPLSHGSSTVNIAMTARAAKTVFLPTQKFSEEQCWELIEQHKITCLFLVPTMLMRLVRYLKSSDHDHSTLTHVIYAGAPISREDQKEALQALGPVLVQYYGSGELLGHGTVLTPAMHSLRDDDPLAPPGTAGVARTGTDLEILDQDFLPLPCGSVGSICIKRGPGAFSGYFRDDPATSEVIKGDWLFTGDVGYLNERGFLFIVGRTKEIYKSGGLQVFPNETENTLCQHDGVAEACVIPFPDSEWGEVGVAIVTARDDGELDEDTLKTFLRERLSGYKIPKRIFIWTEIPRSAVGKLQKPSIRAEIYKRRLLQEGIDIR